MCEPIVEPSVGVGARVGVGATSTPLGMSFSDEPGSTPLDNKSGGVKSGGVGVGGLGCALGISDSDDAATLGPPEAGGPDNSGGMDSAPMSGEPGKDSPTESSEDTEVGQSSSCKDSEVGALVLRCASGTVTREACVTSEAAPSDAPSDITFVSATCACCGVILQRGQGSVPHASGGSAVVFWLM